LAAFLYTYPFFMKTTMIDQSRLQILAPENDLDLTDLASLLVPAYKQVFGDETWCEGWKCRRCNKKYALRDPCVVNGDCCGQQLEEFYSDADVLKMFQELLLRRYQLRVVMEGSERVVGFQWGWQDTLAGMNSKLDLWPEILEQLGATLKTKGLYSDVMYYWSESGVLPAFRRLGLAKLMYQDIRQVLRCDVRSKLLRTTPRSPQYQFSRQQGDVVVLNYSENTRDRRVMDDRVLLAGVL
jgi:hypothetical protein